MKQFVFSLIIFCCFIACEQGAPTKKVQKLRKVTDLEILALIKSRNFSYLYADFKNQNGNELSEAEKDSLDRGLLGGDYYQNEEGIIRQVLVRPKVRKDSIIEAIQKALIRDPLENYARYEVSCDSLDQIFENSKSKYPSQWTRSGNTLNYNDKFLEVVLSVIATCGWEEAYLGPICSSLLAAPKGTLAYFYSELKLLFNEEKLSSEQLNAIENRLLSRANQATSFEMTRLTRDELSDTSLINSYRRGFNQIGIDSNIFESLLREWKATADTTESF